MSMESEEIVPSRAKSSSLWSHVPFGLADDISETFVLFRKDKNPKKIDLCMGVYRDDNGNSCVFQSVLKAEDNIRLKRLDKDYLPSSGNAEFCKHSIAFALGDDNEIVKNGLNATVQGSSGTGSIAIGMLFLKQYITGPKEIYLPSPAWLNYLLLLQLCDFTVKYYRYYSAETNKLDFKGMLEDINKIPMRSVVILQTPGHNPTGIDPTPQQWIQLSNVIKRRQLFPFFDTAYQGVTSGDPVKDSFAVRQFAKDGHQFALAQSYSKNMGLYGERLGTFSLITSNKVEAERVSSQLRLLIRGTCSNPPINGARIACEIFNNHELKQEWFSEMKAVSDRLKLAREMLFENLRKCGSKCDWSHILNQVGMFCYTGLNEAQIMKLRDKYSIYLPRDGRLSVGGITSTNVDRIAEAIHDVTK